MDLQIHIQYTSGKLRELLERTLKELENVRFPYEEVVRRVKATGVEIKSRPELWGEQEAILPGPGYKWFHLPPEKKDENYHLYFEYGHDVTINGNQLRIHFQRGSWKSILLGHPHPFNTNHTTPIVEELFDIHDRILSLTEGVVQLPAPDLTFFVKGPYGEQGKGYTRDVTGCKSLYMFKSDAIAIRNKYIEEIDKILSP